jgi:serine/threonine-protein kinase RsbW
MTLASELLTDTGPARSCAHSSAALTIRSDVAEVFPILDQVEKLLVARKYDQPDLFAVRLALEEALLNAVKHGNRMEHNKPVRIAYRVTDARFDITIEDEGAGFNPDEVADPLACGNLGRLGGRGLLLMRHYMSHVTLHPPGNKVTMSRLRRAPSRNEHALPMDEKEGPALGPANTP